MGVLQTPALPLGYVAIYADSSIADVYCQRVGDVSIPDHMWSHVIDLVVHLCQQRAFHRRQVVPRTRRPGDCGKKRLCAIGVRADAAQETPECR